MQLVLVHDAQGWGCTASPQWDLLQSTRGWGQPRGLQGWPSRGRGSGRGAARRCPGLRAAPWESRGGLASMGRR